MITAASTPPADSQRVMWRAVSFSAAFSFAFAAT
jgi:hypothetical protein